MTPDRILKFVIALIFILLIFIGSVNMYGISSKLENNEIFQRFLVSSGISIVAFLFGFILSLRSKNMLVYLGSILFIMSVLLILHAKFKGLEAFGAKRWISVAGITFQPTEIAKISCVILTSYIISLIRKKIAVLYSAFINIVPAIFTAIQPDVGSASVFLVIFLLSVLISRFPVSLFAMVLIFLLIFSPFVWKYGLKDYHKKRISTFLNPESELFSSGYQTVQSKIAIGSGGLMGMGLGKGEHSKGKWLPNLHSDLAFVSIAEDFGFVGVLTTLLIILIFISAIFIRALISDSYFVEVFSTILGATISYHILLNLFVISGLFPVVGIPFTFISFAGTHNISMSFLLGTCLGIREKKKEEFEIILSSR
ncbi:MAG: FtsW/RodA/SpoVE family cell cycle protein [Candidatus Calescibacterium sp.]